eukprot:CAMPEP_0116946618 /NCGR_PEP_ID=MMETSP0467-20121206/37109_1 /TAXON_ID=283647 /ORGANISM="Mesodinium pulex, Strain SPMC105" /LENGTH=63 /DNA_ID=CAMNT_0004630463 /DNA_START=258 /DNA_END=449 /DNA_ORIENTATION=+
MAKLSGGQYAVDPAGNVAHGNGEVGRNGATLVQAAVEFDHNLIRLAVVDHFEVADEAELLHER